LIFLFYNTSVRKNMPQKTTGSNTSTDKMSASQKVAKRVSKKTEEAVAAPVVAAPAKEVAKTEAKETKKAAAKTVAKAEVKEVAKTVAAAVPEAQAVATESTESGLSVAQEIESLIVATQTVRDSAAATIASLKKLQKRVARELKDAGRKKKRSSRKEGDDATREKRPTIFTTPVTLKDELCAFLGKPKGTQMTPADVTKSFSSYVESHKLKDQREGEGHTIHPDAAMRKVLGVKEGETLTYRNIQRYLYKLYVLPEKKN